MFGGTYIGDTYNGNWWPSSEGRSVQPLPTSGGSKGTIIKPSNRVMPLGRRLSPLNNVLIQPGRRLNPTTRRTGR